MNIRRIILWVLPLLVIGLIVPYIIDAYTYDYESSEKLKPIVELCIMLGGILIVVFGADRWHISTPDYGIFSYLWPILPILCHSIICFVYIGAYMIAWCDMGYCPPVIYMVFFLVEAISFIASLIVILLQFSEPKMSINRVLLILWGFVNALISSIIVVASAFQLASNFV